MLFFTPSSTSFLISIFWFSGKSYPPLPMCKRMYVKNKPDARIKTWKWGGDQNPRWKTEWGDDPRHEAGNKESPDKVSCSQQGI